MCFRSHLMFAVADIIFGSKYMKRLRTCALAILAATLPVLTGCSGQKTASQISNTQTAAKSDRVAQIDTSETAATDTPHASLSQQKQCADQSKRAFDEYVASVKNSKDGMGYGFTSHFDQKNNICYILVNGGPMMNRKPAFSSMVFDAYEGRQYADYFWMNTDNKKYWEVAPLLCNVQPRNAEQILCQSDEEFTSLIEKYFGIGR
jgi:hypothetical protein